MTILLTTHYLEEADRLASQLAIVDRGRIVAEGTPDELKSELRGRHASQVELVDAQRRRGARGARARRRRRRRGARRAARCTPARATARAAIPAVLAALDAHGVRAASVTLARPVARRRLPAPRGARFDRADASTTRGGGGMSARSDRPGRSACATCACCARQPAFLGITLMQPIIWLLLFGALFKAVTQIPGFHGGSYVDFLTPGVVVMLAVSSAGWTGMGFIEDINARRHGPHARLARVARRAEPGQRRLRDDHDRDPDGADRRCSRWRSAPTTSTASAAC